MSELEIRALTPQTWPAFARMVERHNGVFGGCWCTWFHTLSSEKEHTAEANRALKQRLVEGDRAHAALLFDGDEAIAWCEYGAAEELPNIYHRKEYDETATAAPDYRITCLFVDRRQRRQGLTDLVLQGALDLIGRAGGGVVEGYPHDPPPGKRVACLYNGTRHLFERAGFVYERSKGAGNCVMRKDVPAS